MTILFYILLSYLAFSVIYNALFAIASTGKKKTVSGNYDNPQNRIAVFIPAYKEDAIIFDTAKKALNQRYPGEKYEVIVIADSLHPATIEELYHLPITVIEVEFEKSTKAKAINKAYELLQGEYDITVVLDSDNVMAPNFLAKINRAYNQGYKAIQGHRVAKNQENNMAVLDAISEEINNNIFRKGHQNLQLSSALIGSGMAFDYELFKTRMDQIEAIGGFDKELELSLLKDNIEIAYLEDALIYDEKVSREEVFTNQRTRWISAQIRYGLHSFGDALIHLIKTGNINYFDKSLQFLLPPRLILLGLTTMLAFASVLMPPTLSVISVSVWASYVMTLFIATPKQFLSKQTLRACWLLPKTFMLMIVALKGYKKAKTNFLHTPHQSV